eukprot:4543862-Ditylum_brightwellii.AAC.1
MRGPQGCAKTLLGLNCNHRLTHNPGPARHGRKTVRPEFRTPQHWSYVCQWRNEEHSNDTSSLPYSSTSLI